MISNVAKTMVFKSMNTQEICYQRLYRFCSGGQQKQLVEKVQQPKDQQIELNRGQELIEKTYEEVKIDSFQNRNFSSLTDLQKEIVSANRFDLSNPEIRPKMTSISAVPGLSKGEEITEVDLGSVKVKGKNQVFLSEVDPRNIPEDYEIRFDTQKRLTLVGKKVLKGGSSTLRSNQDHNIMEISTSESVEQQTMEEISEKYMGQIGYKYEFSRKESLRGWLYLVPVIWIIAIPLFKTIGQVADCLESIEEIENEQFKEIESVKKARMVKVLLDNPDFNGKVI